MAITGRDNLCIPGICRTHSHTGFRIGLATNRTKFILFGEQARLEQWEVQLSVAVGLAGCLGELLEI